LTQVNPKKRWQSGAPSLSNRCLALNDFRHQRRFGFIRPERSALPG